MALTTEQENKLVSMLAAFENGKRINELEDAQGAVGQMLIEVMDETGETRKAELGAAVENASNPIAGRYWNENNATPTAAGHYGSLQALRDLPKKLGLGRYLVADDRTRRKLDPVDSTRFEDAVPPHSTARWGSVCGVGTPTISRHGKRVIIRCLPSHSHLLRAKIRYMYPQAESAGWTLPSWIGQT